MDQLEGVGKDGGNHGNLRNHHHLNFWQFWHIRVELLDVCDFWGTPADY
jgi:hypothetical protein